MFNYFVNVNGNLNVISRREARRMLRTGGAVLVYVAWRRSFLFGPVGDEDYYALDMG